MHRYYAVDKWFSWLYLIAKSKFVSHRKLGESQLGDLTYVASRAKPGKQDNDGCFFNQNSWVSNQPRFIFCCILSRTLSPRWSPWPVYLKISKPCLIKLGWRYQGDDKFDFFPSRPFIESTCSVSDSESLKISVAIYCTICDDVNGQKSLS